MSGYRLPDDVGWTVPPAEPDTIVVSRLPDGPPYALNDTAARIWSAAIDPEVDDVDAVVATVARAAGQPVDEIGGDVRRVLADLVDLGLLATAD